MRYHDCFSDLTPDCSNSYAIVGMIRFYDISNFPLSVSRNINTGNTDVWIKANYRVLGIHKPVSFKLVKFVVRLDSFQFSPNG